MKNSKADLYSKGDLFKRMSIGRDSKVIAQVEKRTPEQIANVAPIGSEVVFHNLKAKYEASYRFENAIKIGQDRYLAYPFRHGSKGLRGEEIRSKLAAREPGSTPSDVRINSVVVFDLP
jgi:hypothetical protein